MRGYKYGGEHRLGGEVLTAHPKFDPDTGKQFLLLMISGITKDDFLLGAI